MLQICTPINVYKVEHLTVKFKEGKAFNWQFYVADVPYPILGGDALAHYHFLPDLTERKVVDSSGQIIGEGIVNAVNPFTIS